MRHKGRRADVGIRPYEIPGSVAVGVDALIDPSAKRHKGRRADVGIRPYEIPGSVGVGVDALIDPSAKRPGMREK